MGQRGPKPRPKFGTPVRAKYPAGVPRLPGWLNKAARAVWKRTVAELAAAKTVAVVDGELVAAYASAVADLELMSKELDAAGLVVEVQTVDRNGRPTGHTVRKPNPLLKAKVELLGRVRQLADALGVGPVARTRVDTAPAVGEAERPNAVLMLKARIERARQTAGPPHSS